MRYLYCYKGSQGVDVEETISCDVFTPGICKGLLLPGETGGVKKIGARLLFQILTLGKAKVFFVADGGNLMHTSYVVPRCVKFPFMGNGDYEIGPCFTYPQYRGKGIYPSVLKAICNCVGDENTTFYMIVDENNIASIKGIEKAGFQKCGIVEVAKFTKRYLLKTKL